MRDCPACGASAPEDFRFCGRCGAALDATTTAEQGVRKTVTVLFSDVTGSTALGERLDPETLRRLMGAYFDAVRSVLEHHGGTVEKFIGDAVMAVFGTPRVHEDDALRACRAALAMRTELDRLNVRFQHDWGVEIVTRTGINTGQVVAGGPGEGRASSPMTLVTGDAVNVAARLEQAAEPGEILLGQTTYALVRDDVVVETMAALTVRGKRDAVAAVRLVALAPAAPDGRRLESAMIGRDRERLILDQAFERAVSDRACQLFTVLGGAGVGKSRLVHEFVRDARERATILRGRCLPYGDGITYWPVVEIVKQASGMGAGEAPESARAMLDAAFGGGPDGPRMVERIAQLMGLSDVPAPAEETRWAIRRLIESLAATRPLVVVFDDVQWAQPTFLDLIEHIAEWSRDVPILLLVVSRQELLELRPSWGGGKLNATTILLEPLGATESQRLIANLAGQVDLPAAIAERIAGAAEGNPLFVEELFAMLLDEGALRRDDDHLVATQDLATLKVPPTIAAIIAARLDRILGTDRAALERAAVVGKAFWRDAVAELSPPAERLEIADRLRDLIRKDFVRPDRSTFPDDEGYRFRHILVRDTAYDGLPKEVRADLHLRFARWLERVAGDRVAEFEEVVAYHLEQAYRYRLELGPLDDVYAAAGSEAGERLGTAGRRALARGDLPAAISLLERAAGLLTSDAPGRALVLTELGSALTERGEFARASAIFTGAIEAAERAGDEGASSRAALTRLHVMFFTDPGGVAETTRNEVERLIPIFEARGDELGLAKARRRLALVHRTHGAGRSMADELRLAIDHARRAGDAREEARSVSLLAMADWLGPTPAAEAEVHCRALLVESAGDRTAERGIRYALAALAAIGGRIDEARRELAARLAICEELGLRGETAETVALAGWIDALAGDFEAADDAFGRACATFRTIGDRNGLAAGSADRARVLTALGRDAAAIEAAAESEVAAAPDDVPTQATWRGAAAVARARSGEPELARTLAEESVRLAFATDRLTLQGDCLVAAADAYRTLGDPTAAEGALHRALERYERKGHVLGIAAVQARLGTGAPDPSVPR